jgi:hypothetical protein
MDKDKLLKHYMAQRASLCDQLGDLDYNSMNTCNQTMEINNNIDKIDFKVTEIMCYMHPEPVVNLPATKPKDKTK